MDGNSKIKLLSSSSFLWCNLLIFFDWKFVKICQNCLDASRKAETFYRYISLYNIKHLMQFGFCGFNELDSIFLSHAKI